MTRNTHDRFYDHHGTDEDSNIVLSAATSSYADNQGLHSVLESIDARLLAAESGGGGGGGFVDLLTGDSSTFETSIGSWVEVGDGSATWDSSVHLVGTVGSLRHDTVSTTGYIEISLPGTFEAGKTYHALFSIYTTTGIYIETKFGLIGTDSYDNDLQALQVDKWSMWQMNWTPSADRTGVKLRLRERYAGNITYYVGFLRVFEGDTQPVISLEKAIVLPFTPWGAGSSTFSVGPFQGGGLRFTPFDVYYESPDVSSGLDAGNNGYLFMYAEHATASSLVEDGFNLEVGPDYVGLYFSEKDANTLQIYPDWSGGYDIELVDRGSRKWYAVTAAGVRYALTDALAVVSGGVGSSLIVQESDGSPLVTNVNTLKFLTGTLIDDGGGVATYSGSGATGPQGDAGVGVPAGGATGEVLAKIDGTDYNTEWVTPAGGGGLSQAQVLARGLGA